jgi:hypothetical protein
MTASTARDADARLDWPDTETCLLCGTAPFDLSRRALHHLRAAADALLAAHHPDLALELRVLTKRIEGRVLPR